jgi:hypothetical protein
MRILRPLALVLIALVARPAFPQDAPAKRLTNQDIIEMTNLNLSDDVIIAKIRSATGADASKFDTTVDGLKALKAANVSDAVIKVMINPAPPPPPVVTTAAPMTLDPNFPPPEIGVYWKDGPTFVFIEGAAIARTKAGGRAASFATDGIRGQHWDAVLEGPTSKNHVKDRRPIFYLYVPDGSSAADYALIKLQKKGDRREFQVGSFGGIGGGKSGVKKDKEVSCSSEHVGIRMYKITLNEDLKPGEYAFFMGTGSQSNMSSGRVSSSSGGAASGRVFDFNIPE